LIHCKGREEERRGEERRGEERRGEESEDDEHKKKKPRTSSLSPSASGVSTHMRAHTKFCCAVQYPVMLRTHVLIVVASTYGI